MQQIPMYVFTGFLESGKTKFIQETLEDPRFNSGEKTLLLVLEEGEEEYDLSRYPSQNVYLETPDYDELSPEFLEGLRRKYNAERVVAELNGMHQAADFYMKTPDSWVIAQEVMFADAQTFQGYNANMRQLVVDKLMGAELVVFNRMTPGADIMPFHKIARAVNRKIDIMYEYTDGTSQFDEIIDPLPFDIDAPIIEIADKDYAVWYADMTEEEAKYYGKTIRFKGRSLLGGGLKDDEFVIGRHIMTCCVEDIQFGGLVAKYKDAQSLEHGGWVDMTAKIEREYNDMYQSEGPVFHVISVTKIPPIADEVATFY